MNKPFSTTLLQTIKTSFLPRQHGLLIGGKWYPAKSGKTFPVYNPADAEVIAHVAEGDKADVDAAVAAARRAFEEGPWATMLPSARAKLLWRLADAIEAHGEEFALIETLNSGKLLRNCRAVDVPNAVENLRYTSGWATKLNGETITMSTGTGHAYTVREPVGVVGQILPWNSPLAMAVAKIAPALAAGCTVVLKPAEQTPLSAIRLGELIQEVGFPDGVVNIVQGFGETAGAAISAHPGIDKVAFTGSTEVGKAIIRAATGNLKRVTVELGGKSPNIIFPDADLERAIPGVIRAIFNNTGQFCAAGSRLFAHRSVFDKIIAGVVARAEKLKIGPGLDPDTELGPLVSKDQFERVTGFLKSGREQGARVATGGSSLDRKGYYVQPTIFTNIKPDMAILRQEIFGPVLCAMPFDDADLDRIAREANDTMYGLAAYIWTRDLTVAHKLARKIKAGSVRINGAGVDCVVPFGGFKQSGWGREYGREGVEIYTELKSVMIAL